MSWAGAFALTLGIEVPLVVGASVAFGMARWPRALGAAVVVNRSSHPLLWFVLVPAMTGPLGYDGAVLVAEATVVALETGGYMILLPARLRPALALAFCANLASLAIGLLLARL